MVPQAPREGVRAVAEDGAVQVTVSNLLRIWRWMICLALYGVGVYLLWTRDYLGAVCCLTMSAMYYRLLYVSRSRKKPPPTIHVRIDG